MCNSENYYYYLQSRDVNRQSVPCKSRLRFCPTWLGWTVRCHQGSRASICSSAIVVSGFQSQVHPCSQMASEHTALASRVPGSGKRRMEREVRKFKRDTSPVFKHGSYKSRSTLLLPSHCPELTTWPQRVLKLEMQSFSCTCNTSFY